MPYIQSLRDRIYKVCEGHMTWLREVRSQSPSDQAPGEQQARKSDVAEMSTQIDGRGNLLPSGCFAANYWPTGKLMRLPPDSQSWLPGDSIRDTAIQLLKVADFINVSEKQYNVVRKDLRDLLNDIHVPWLYELDKRDRRGKCAWPHAQDDGINTFRLEDHYWIWKALESAKILDLDSTEPQLTAKSSTEERKSLSTAERDKWLCILEEIPEDEKYRLKIAGERYLETTRRLRSVDVQKTMLQRFTTETDSPRQRMLAVTRSPRQTRFLLHARDTALFYDQGGFLLADTAFKGLWEKTLSSQVLHEENEDTTWENALRFALGILVASSGFRLNKRSSIDLMRYSTQALLRSCCHNGFIGSELVAGTHAPLLFTDENDRDYYYHASFEIPYILLTNAQRIDEDFVETTTKVQSNVQQQAPHSVTAQEEKLPQLDESLAALLIRLLQPTNTSSQSLDIEKLRHAVNKTQANFMKKEIPFGSLIDARNIINIDEEWLYSYPEFLLTRDMKQPSDEFRLLERSDERVLQIDNMGYIVEKGSTNYQSSEKARKGQEFAENTVTFVANAPKQKRRSKRDKRQQGEPATATMRNNKGLWSVIGKKRTPEIAKKRFIWLPHPNTETAFLCWLASTESEKPEISLFFDRHLKYEHHFWDSTTRSLNIWQTELHLSFYTLVHIQTPRHVGIPDQVHVPFPSGSMELRRASMGFRFDGDLFDRYWTCHFVQYVPCWEAPVGSKPDYSSKDNGDSAPGSIDPKTIPAHKWDFEFDEDAFGRFKEKHWWQRKVLELYLLKRILDLVIENSAKILDEVKKELGIKSDTASFSTLNSEAYASSKDNWKRFELILQGVDEDLTSVLKTLEQWKIREKERAPEEPRWTRNDERKYRSHINKFRGFTERQVWLLEMQRDRVRKLRDTLDTSMEKIRTDLELKREENIRYFTYVTVIFLPLGFAASFYSMVRDN